MVEQLFLIRSVIDLANMHLVTGYGGQEHVTAADQAVFNSYLFGIGQFVMNRGNKLSASVITNNKIRVLDGDIYMQGRHVRLNENTYVDLHIDNGEQSMLRNDLIVARYTKDSMTGVEEVNLVVIKGTSVSSNPVDPEYTSGSIINDGVILNDMPLYRVPLNGLNVSELVTLFEVKEDKFIQDKQDRTNELAAESSLEDADALPFFDASANVHRKTLLSSLKTFLSNAFASKTHKHDATDITSGILPLSKGGTGASVSSIAELAASLGAAKIVTGSYVGTKETTKTFSFGFDAKLLIIFTNVYNDGKYNASHGYLYIKGSVTALNWYKSHMLTTNSANSIFVDANTVLFDGTTISADTAINAANANGATYVYIAIG